MVKLPAATKRAKKSTPKYKKFRPKALETSFYFGPDAEKIDETLKLIPDDELDVPLNLDSLERPYVPTMEEMIGDVPDLFCYEELDRQYARLSKENVVPGAECCPEAIKELVKADPYLCLMFLIEKVDKTKFNIFGNFGGRTIFGRGEAVHGNRGYIFDFERPYTKLRLESPHIAGRLEPDPILALYEELNFRFKVQRRAEEGKEILD